MQLINSRDINKLLEDKGDPGELFDIGEETIVYPCWQIKIDGERKEMLFIVDKKEWLAYPIAKLSSFQLEIDGINNLMVVFRTGDLNAVKKELVRK